MRIGIDARFWGPAGKGLGRYTQQLVMNLARIDSHNAYWIFIRDAATGVQLSLPKNFQIIVAPYRWYSFSEQTRFPRLISRYRLDLMHFPHFNVPFFYRRPFVVTIHDLIITNYPTTKATTLGPVKYYFKHLGYQLVIAAAVRRARAILTVSHYVKKDLVAHFRVDPARVQVTYEAADPFTGIEAKPDDVLKTHGLARPYLLYVGNAYPHKNLERLIDAFADLIRESPRLQLVLVGKMDYFFLRLREYVSARGLSGAVVFPGFIPDKDLPALYRSALLYVFPSLSEGFGLPPLEAMLYGLPVAAARSSCLPEVLGDAAAYFNPADKRDIVGVLRQLIASETERIRHRQAGDARVRQFSWERMARETLAIYQQHT